MVLYVYGSTTDSIEHYIYNTYCLYATVLCYDSVFDTRSTCQIKC